MSRALRAAGERLHSESAAVVACTGDRVRMFEALNTRRVRTLRRLGAPDLAGAGHDQTRDERFSGFVIGRNADPMAQEGGAATFGASTPPPA